MSDLKAYLASKYMSGPKADAILARSGDPSLKKRKKKPKNEDYVGGSSSKENSSGLILQDEEDQWKRKDADDVDVEGEDAPVIGKALATFKKSKSQWNTVGSATSIPLRAPSVKEEPEDPNEQAEAESSQAGAAPKQVTKRRGGLRTAAQMQEEVARAKAAARSPTPEKGDGRPDPTQTVHRDASGRIMDVEALKAEAKRQEEEERRKERDKEEWSKGFKQREERERQVRLEREMASQDVARRADDVAMNAELKEVERWNDPAAEFLTTKAKKKRGPRRPQYQGSYAPNRFGIPPGFRWDGVDRSTGFEKKYFQYQNAAVRAEMEHNAWSMEDM